jgi:hypothetical protein
VSSVPTHDGPHGTNLLPHDLTEQELMAAPVLESLDVLEVADLTDDEYGIFTAALSG